MARVTVEDCLDHVENRFKLVLLASKRARQLSMGTEPLVEWENDKPTVVALREIEDGLVNEEMMEAALAQPVEEEMPFDEDDLAAALHAEISRELTQPAPEGQIASEQVEAASNPFSRPTLGSSSSQDQATSEAEITPQQSEPSSMEALLAQELAASSNDTPASDPAVENPFAAAQNTESENPFTSGPTSNDEDVHTPNNDADGDQ